MFKYVYPPSMGRSFRGVPWSKTPATDFPGRDSSRIAWFAAGSSCEGRASSLILYFFSMWQSLP